MRQLAPRALGVSDESRAGGVAGPETASTDSGARPANQACRLILVSAVLELSVKGGESACEGRMGCCCPSSLDPGLPACACAAGAADGHGKTCVAPCRWVVSPACQALKTP
eukprot:1152901-Pelagomonas_calceolata.AAC.13